MKIIKQNYLASRNIEGVAYIVDTKTSTLHELNETGTLIWQFLDKKDKSFIIKEIVKYFDISEEGAEKDFDEFVKSLLAKNLIAVNP